MVTLPRALPHECDAVIVGAGAAGTLAASILAQAGKQVVVLEAGPAWELTDLTSSQIWSRRLKWGGAPVMGAGSLPFGNGMATGWGIGGSALHHYANWPRLMPDDFALASKYGKGLDWPFGYDELRPWYDRIQAEIGLSGDAEAEVWRPPGAPYPQGPIPTFPQAARIARGFEARGWRTAPVPLAILTEPVGDRKGCLYDGWCDAGCPTGALANPLVTYRKPATDAGARFFAESTVTRIEVDAKGRATGVTVVQGSAVAATVRAPVVILAASAIHSARLLLVSGIGNSSGQVGVGFMPHALVNIFGLFDAPLDNHLGVTGGNLVCREAMGKTPAPGAFGSHEWVLGPALKPNDLIGIAMARPDLYGQRLARFLQIEGKTLAVMGALCETLHRPENRIELASAKDQYGVPLARVTHSPAPETLALLKHATEEGTAIMRAAGAREVWAAPPVTTHPQGGTIMGSDPATSVVDPYAMSWDVPNLMVLGGGLHPSIGAAGPTFTIHAVTARAVDHLVANWTSLAR